MKIIGLILSILILCSSIFAQGAIKQEEIGNTSCEDYLSRMEVVRSVLLSEPDTKIYLLIYEGKENLYNPKTHKINLVLPAYGSAQARIDSIKKRFEFMQSKHLLERIVFVKAGFRMTFAVEVWFVPNDATPPSPTPTLKKMRYRKGKPQGFCAGCC